MSTSSGSTHKLPIVVIGGGISGLSAAFRLHQAGKKVIVCEAGDRPGGNIQTAHHDGFLYDLGPDSFLRAKVHGEQLCCELGLEDELIAPQPGATQVFVAHAGTLYPMPEGLSLGVPKRAGPLLDTPLLSSVEKARAFLEPFVPPSRSDEDESITAFTSRRLGSGMATRLAAPLLSGVFAGDADKLSMQATFPQLLALEKKYGSLFSGMNGGKSILQVLTTPVTEPQSPFISLRSGLSSLVDALLAHLPLGAVRLNSPVTGLIGGPGSDDPVQVEVDGNRLKASHVIFAGPPWAAANLFGQSFSKLAAPLSQVRGFATATVFFALNEVDLQQDLQGSGFIVPPGEAEILAGTFVSSKWEGRAPEGKALIRAFIGGARQDIRSKSDDELRRIAHRELTRLLGPLGPVIFSRVHVYRRGTPQPEMGHLKLLREVEGALNELPWLSLVGSGYDGVGIPDCIRQAEDAAALLI